jgi:hypothetical protein
MVEFNRTPGPNQAPSYLNESKNVDRAQPNRAFEALFEGVGNTLRVAAAEKQSTEEQAIDKAVYKSHDQVSSEVILANTEANNLGADNFFQTSTGSPDVSNSIGRLERLSQAKAAGKISDTYYWSQLNSTTQSLRAKYPNQRQYIDQRVSQITGGTPANQLRNALQQDLEKQQRILQSQQTKQDTFVQNNLGLIPEGLLKAYNEGSPEAYTEIQYTVASRKRDDEDISATKARLELSSQQGKLNVEDAQQGAANNVNMVVSRFITDTASRAGVVNFNQLQDRITSFAGSGKAPTPEEQTQLLADFAQLKYQLGTQVRNALTQPDSNGKSWSTYLDPTRVKQLEEQGMAQINQLEDLITNQQYGLVNMVVNQHKAQMDSKVKNLVDQYPVYQNIEVLKRIGGDQLVSLSLTTDGGKLLGDATKALLQAQVTDSAVNGTSSLNKYAQELKQTTAKDPAAFQELISSHANIMLAKDTPDQVAIQVAQSMFGTDNTPFIQNFRTNGDKMAVFSKMSSPQMTAKIQELAKADPAVWQNYSNWSKQAFLTTFGGYIDSTQEGVTARPYTQINYDPTTSQFTFALTPEGQKAMGKAPVTSPITGPVTGGLMYAAESWMTSTVQSSVQELNRGISLIRPILEAEGADVNTEIVNLVKSKGLDTSMSKQDSFWSKLYRAAVSSDQSIRQNVGDTVRGQEPTGGSPFEAFFGEWTATPQNPASERPVLDFIGGAEAAGNYNAISGNAKNAEPLDTLTISQVLDLQKHMISNKDKFPSSAVGKYQFINGTLISLIRELDLDKDALFTPELQDRLGYSLLERRGLSRYRSGELSKDQFAKNLAQEWASLPLPSGRSYYEGDGTNKALVSYDDFIGQL